MPIVQGDSQGRRYINITTIDAKQTIYDVCTYHCHGPGESSGTLFLETILPQMIWFKGGREEKDVEHLDHSLPQPFCI